MPAEHYDPTLLAGVASLLIIAALAIAFVIVLTPEKRR